MSDQLLEWMSFRKLGRVADLPTTLAGERPHRAIDNLVTLGHAEWDAKDKWRIAPPTLAGASDGTRPLAILCGARTSRLLAKVNGAAAACGATIETTAVTNLPAIVRVIAPSPAALVSIGRLTNIPFQPSAALSLLACTPTIAGWRRESCEMVRGRVGDVRRFSGSRLTWLATSLAAATTAKAGFFRIQRDYDWVSIFKTSATECAYIDDRAGRIAAAAKLKLLRWDSVTDVLFIPSQLYPPTLIVRALALCTGNLPRFDRGAREISFDGVTPPIFRMVEAITGLRSR